MLLEVIGLKKVFKQTEAVKGIDFQLDKGNLLGLLGPNGAGKSTTISMISTLLKPTAGRILFKEHDIVKDPRKIQPYLGIVPQELALYTALSGVDNLNFWGKAYGLRGKKLRQRVSEISQIIGIKERLNDPIDTYSGGMKRRINFGAALLHQPELLIMDEPTVGIDPQSRNHILQTVKYLNETGTTMIYTSHYMEEVEALCDNICIMDQGNIIASGSKQALLQEVDYHCQFKVTFSEVHQTMIKQLRQQLHFENIQQQGDTLTFQAASSRMVKAVFDIASLHDVEIGTVQIIEPNLESVFLQLTGKALRD